MKKILKVEYPIITSYPGIAATMAVLGSDDKFKLWICNNLNNIVYINFMLDNRESWGNFHDIHFPNYGMPFEKVPFIESSRLHKSVVNLMCEDIKEFLMKCINENYYLYLALDNYYIPHSNAYKSSHFRHSTFVYGYDTEKNIVYIADFYNSNKYNFYTILFEEFIKAYYDSIDETDYCKVMNIFRIDKSFDYSSLNIDCDLIHASLNDYIHSTDANIARHTKKDLYNGGTPNFGLSYFDKLILDVRLGQANIQSFHILYDYALIMKYKLDTIYAHGFICEKKYLLMKEQANQIVKLSLICRNRFIMLSKNNYDCNDTFIKKIIKLRDLSKQFVEAFIQLKHPFS